MPNGRSDWPVYFAFGCALVYVVIIVVGITFEVY